MRLTFMLSDRQLQEVLTRLDRIADQQVNRLSLLRVLDRAATAMESVDAKLRAIWFSLRRPGCLGVVLISQEDAMRFKFAFTLPPVNPADGVVSRAIRYAVDGVSGELSGISADSKQSEAIVAGLGAEVTATLVDTDVAGNASEPSDPFAWTVVDTIPPAKPGALGVVELEQVADDPILDSPA